MTASSPAPLPLLVLARVASAGAAGETRAATGKALGPYLAGRHARLEVEGRLDGATADLVAAGRLREEGSRRAAATDEGLRMLEGALGLEALPAARCWLTLRDAHLPAHALGLSPTRGPDLKRFKTASGLRAAVLTHAHALPLALYPTLSQVAKALAWKRLALKLDRSLPPELAPRFGTGPVIETLVSDWIEGGRPRPLDRALALLAARAVGVMKPDAATLRRGIIARWLDAHEDEPAPAPAKEIDPDLQAFAVEIVDLATGSAEPRFGPDCVYVAHVVDAYRSRHAEATSEDVKRRLAAANNRGLLHLQRADLVEALPRDLLQRSEVTWLGTQFHFVRIDG